MSQQIVQFKLKLPKDVKDWVAVSAIHNTRSTTAEIVHILKQKMETETKKATEQQA